MNKNHRKIGQLNKELGLLLTIILFLSWTWFKVVIAFLELNGQMYFHVHIPRGDIMYTSMCVAYSLVSVTNPRAAFTILWGNPRVFCLGVRRLQFDVVIWKGIGASLVVQMEEAMAPHSSTLAWKVPWTEELDRLQSMGLRRVRHYWVTSLSLSTFMHWRRKWQPTPVFLPGESQGWGSLVGCRLWGRTESDTTEAT